MISSLGEAVAERGTEVQLELLVAAERDERGQRDRASRAAVEAGPRPDLAPGVPRDQILEVGGERRRARDRTVDVRVAEHLAPDLHSRSSLVAHLHAPRGRQRAHDRRARRPSRGRSPGRTPRRAPPRQSTPASASRRAPPDAAARRPRSVTACLARPTRRASRNTTRSLITPPRVRSRFARIRACVDLEPLERRRIAAAAPPAIGERVRERAPLGLPGAERALVLLRRARRSSTPPRPDSPPRAGDRDRRADRVSLLRHRRGAARHRPARAPRRPRSARAGRRRARSSRTTPAATARAPRRARRCGARSVCHGSTGFASSSSAAKRAATSRPVGAERRERARSTAEL